MLAERQRRQIRRHRGGLADTLEDWPAASPMMPPPRLHASQNRVKARVNYYCRSGHGTTLSSTVFCIFYFAFYNLQLLFMLLFYILHVRLIYAIKHLRTYLLKVAWP